MFVTFCRGLYDWWRDRRKLSSACTSGSNTFNRVDYDEYTHGQGSCVKSSNRLNNHSRIGRIPEAGVYSLLPKKLHPQSFGGMIEDHYPRQA